MKSKQQKRQKAIDLKEQAITRHLDAIKVYEGQVTFGTEKKIPEFVQNAKDSIAREQRKIENLKTSIANTKAKY